MLVNAFFFCSSLTHIEIYTVQKSYYIIHIYIYIGTFKRVYIILTETVRFFFYECLIGVCCIFLQHVNVNFSRVSFFIANKKKRKYTKVLHWRFIQCVYIIICLYIYVCHPPAAKRITNDFDNVRLKYFQKVMYHLYIFIPSPFYFICLFGYF